MSRLLPAEIIVGIALGLCVVIAGYNNLAWYLPNESSLNFIALHYLGPVVALVFTVLLSPYFARIHSNRSLLPSILIYGRLGVALAIAVFLHFNLKLWIPLVNPLTYDQIYMSWDQRLPAILDLFNGIYIQLPTSFLGMNNLYHEIFVLMFGLSFVIHGLRNSHSGEAVITGTLLILILGGITYMFAPALGPFIYFPVHEEIQHIMWGFNQRFVETGGKFYKPEFFTAGLAAMPSLHAAHVVMLFIFAWREVRWLGLLYIVPVAYIFIAAIALKWHYLIDIPFGILLGWVCWRLAIWFTATSLETRPVPNTNNCLIN